MNNIIIHNCIKRSSYHVALAILGTMVALELATIVDFIKIATEMKKVIPEDQ